MRIVVASDSHGNNQVLDQLYKHYDADLYLHCGDLEDDPIHYPNWIFVQGNNDWWGTFAKQRSIPVRGHKVYMTHSDRCSYFHREDHLVRLAQMHDCDVAVYGHTHASKILVRDQVLLVNPGSISFPRDGREPSFAIIDLDYTQVSAEIIFRKDWKF